MRDPEADEAGNQEARQEYCHCSEYYRQVSMKGTPECQTFSFGEIKRGEAHPDYYQDSAYNTRYCICLFCFPREIPQKEQTEHSAAED